MAVNTEGRKYMGQVIRSLRTDLGMEAKDLGLALSPKKSPSTVTSWERGETEPSCDCLIQLAELFSVDPGDFYQRRKTRANLSNAFEVANLNTLSDCYTQMNESQRRAVLGVARAMVE